MLLNVKVCSALLQYKITGKKIYSHSKTCVFPYSRDLRDKRVGFTEGCLIMNPELMHLKLLWYSI